MWRLNEIILERLTNRGKVKVREVPNVSMIVLEVVVIHVADGYELLCLRLRRKSREGHRRLA